MGLGKLVLLPELSEVLLYNSRVCSPQSDTWPVTPGVATSAWCLPPATRGEPAARLPAELSGSCFLLLTCINLIFSA